MRATCRLLHSAAAPSGKDFLGILERHFSPAVPRAPKGNNLIVDSARGAWITDVTGRKYLDFQTGIGVTSTGHCHPRVVEAVREQVGKGIHLQQNCGVSRPLVELCEALNANTPSELSRFFFNCTGAEAIESAIKLARHETGRQNVIYFKGGFHGRSLGTLAMTTSKYVYKVGYGPLPSGFHQVPSPYCLHCTCARPAGAACCGSPMQQIRELFKEGCPAADTAAIVMEPILGEGGYVVPPPGFWKELRALCDETGILLVADEVQSGVGRTGRMWALEHEGVVPDILVFAKGIASGMVLSGIASRGHMMSKSPPGSMGGTFGANAVSAAAAVATLDVINSEGLLANAAARGEQLQAGLRALALRHPGHILDVRGRGCMVGLEFNHPAGSGFAGAVTQAAMERSGLLLLTTGWRETIRFIPPLVITKAEVDTALEAVGDAMEHVIQGWKAPPGGA